MRSVFKTVDYDPAEVGAIQALERGDCDEHQQKRALQFIIEKACATYDQSYNGDPYDTAFAEGRRFAGNTIVKMLKLDPSKVRSKDG